MVSATLISSLPPFASPDQHSAIVGATPDSFSDIPPVLRLTENDVHVAFDPPLDEFTEHDGVSGRLYVIERYEASLLRAVVDSTRCLTRLQLARVHV